MGLAANWYADPTSRFALRYWDGTRWTEHVSQGDGATFVDRVAQPAGPNPAKSSREVRPVLQMADRKEATSRSDHPDAHPTQPGSTVAVPSGVVFRIPVPGPIGQVYDVRTRLRRRQVVAVCLKDQNTALVVDQDGETSYCAAVSLSHPIFASPFRCRITRLWAFGVNPVAGFSFDAVEVVRLEMERLTREINDETRAFALEALPFGMSRDHAQVLGVASWQYWYEQVRQGLVAPEDVSGLARRLGTDRSCPAPQKLALSLLAGDEDHSLLAPWPTVSAVLAGETPEASEFLSQVTQFADALDRAGIVLGRSLQDAISRPETTATQSGRVLLALRGGVAATNFILDSSTSAGLIDDLIDLGHRVTVEGDVSDDRAAYLLGRQQPTRLTDEQVLLLNWPEEARRRALLNPTTPLEQYLTPAEKVSVKLRDCVLADGSVDLDALSQIEDLDQGLVDAVRQRNWDALEPHLLDEPAVARMFLTALPPERDPRTTNEGRVMSRSALRAGREALFRWEWNESIRVCQQALTWTQEEIVRDELLNVCAAAQWMSGKHGEALHLLRKALEGNFTLPLLCNAAVVASALEPSEAVNELSRLARQATNDSLRALAFERAVEVWSSSVEDEDDPEPPFVIRDMMRTLLTLDVASDRYRNILAVLAQHDADWLRSRPQQAFGRMSNSPEVCIAQARALGFSEWIAELVVVKAQHPNLDWVDREIGRLGHATLGLLFDAQRANPRLGVSVGIDLLTAGVEFEPDLHIRVVAGTLHHVCQMIDSEDGEPKVEFVGWLRQARVQLARVDPNNREELRQLLSGVGDRLAFAFLSHRDHVLDRIAKTLNELVDHANALIRTNSLDRAEFSKAMKKFSDHALECRAIAIVVEPIISNPELAEAATALRDRCDELHRLCQRNQ